jgi:hypothetical protein
METKFLIWQLEECGTPEQLAQLCVDYNIGAVSVKLLNGTARYNFKHGDKYIRSFVDALHAVGVDFEGWSYNYVEYPGPQGDAIMERAEKFDIDTWQINIEGEFKATGAGNAFVTLSSKLQNRGFYVSVCSYRYPEMHPQIPWKRIDNQEAVDGWSPQVYWALANNPVEQLEKCLRQYEAISGKPVSPMGPGFGDTFSTPTGKVYWEPKVSELEAFRSSCLAKNIPEVYWFRLEWLTKRKRWEMLSAITGKSPSTPPPEPPPVGVPSVVQIRGLDPDEFLRMRDDVWGGVVAMTWNGSKFDVMAAKSDSKDRVWYQVGKSIWIGSWYTKILR